MLEKTPFQAGMASLVQFDSKNDPSAEAPLLHPTASFPMRRLLVANPKFLVDVAE